MNTFLNVRLFQGKKYSGSAVETIGDNAIKLVCLTWSLSVYTSPFILPYLYHKGLLSMNNPNGSFISTIIRITTALFTVFGGGYILRGFGRLGNAEYLSFYTKYSEVKRLTPSQIKERKEELLQRYDFDFRAWPVEYSWYESPNADPHKLPVPLEKKRMDSLTMLPCNVISYIAVHTFGRRMMYPGSLLFLQKAMEPMLIEGRTRLIERFGAERFKIETHERNHIDVIFVDRRGSSSEKGRKLVLCCEGNAGFYEVGIMCTPMDAGYSVLGWNHPGFAASTGLPFPSAETSAIDTIMKFANEKLGYKFEEIILFAWSIGGYPCSWASMAYPDVSGVILDATFDDIVPLAVSKMPTSWKPLVINTVRNYFNLNISDNLSYYSGPIIFIRRLKDEIIHTVETDPVRTNRANDLLIKLLKTRFPHLLTDENPMWALYDWLSGDSEHQSKYLIS